MVGLQQWFRGCRVATMIGVAGLVAGASAALSQDQHNALPPAKDTIFARKILMDTIGHNMDELDGIIGAANIDLNEGHEHADIISVMLMAFPHLFPPATNQWKAGAERDPGTDTFAAPEVWTNYADFYKRAQDASKVAYKASRAESEAEFKDFVAQLRVACDSCHGAYMKQE